MRTTLTQTKHVSSAQVAKRPSKVDKGQVAVRVVENLPDQYQSAWWDGLAMRTVLELSSEGAPESVRFGMKGSPPVTYYGDPGPAGGVPAPSYGAGNAFAKLNADQALPNTSSPSVTSQTLKGLLGEFQ
jgi:hypothetical protein